MLHVRTEKVIESHVFDKFVRNTYGKPYCLQQQDGCMERQRVYITIPDVPYDYSNDTLPEIVNHSEMGVSFNAWLSRSSEEPLSDEGVLRMDKLDIQIWWERNFYPDLNMITNDLYNRGLIEAGDYVINIDW